MLAAIPREIRLNPRVDPATMPALIGNTEEMEALFGQDLCIRPFEKEDAPQFVEAVRESVGTVGAWMPWCKQDYSLDDALEWFSRCEENWRDSHAFDAGIFSRDGKTLIGGIGINQISRIHNFGNVGYWVRESRQGKGVASRAVKVIAEYGFKTLKLTRLEIVASQSNLASRRTAENAGAVFECIARNRLMVRGKPEAAAVFSLIPE